MTALSVVFGLLNLSFSLVLRYVHASRSRPAVVAQGAMSHPTQHLKRKKKGGKKRLLAQEAQYFWLRYPVDAFENTDGGIKKKKQTVGPGGPVFFG